MLLLTQLLYNLPLIIKDTSLLVSSGTNCLNLFQPILILASTAASACPSTLQSLLNDCHTNADFCVLFDIVEAVVVTHEQSQCPQRRQNRREFLIAIVDVADNAGTQQCQLILRRQTVSNLPHTTRVKKVKVAHTRLPSGGFQS